MSGPDSRIQRSDTLLGLVESIYAAVGDEGRWSGVMTLLSELMRSDSFILATKKIAQMSGAGLGVAGVIQSLAISERHAEGYNRFEHLDPLPAMIMRHRLSGFSTPGSAGVERAYRRTEFFNDFVVPAKCENIAVFGTQLQQKELFLGCGFHRGRRWGDFCQEELLFLNRVAHHLVRAVQAHRRIAVAEHRESALRETLNRLATPVMMLTEEARLVWSNAAMDTLMQKGFFLLREGVVLPSRPDDHRQFLRAVKTFASVGELAFSGSPLTLSLSQKSACSTLVEMVPLGVLEPGQTGVLVLATQPDEGSGINTSWLRQAFGLTQAELNLAVLLGQGKSLAEAAQKQGIGVGTARNYLKRTFRKMDIERQSELVWLLRRSKPTVV